jgi:hypothetical protein
MDNVQQVCHFKYVIQFNVESEIDLVLKFCTENVSCFLSLLYLHVFERLYGILVLGFCYAAPALLELASTGEIQFVRPSSDGNYEVLSQEEAAHMMQQPGQTIEIVSDGHDVQVRNFKSGYLNICVHFGELQVSNNMCGL